MRNILIVLLALSLNACVAAPTKTPPVKVSDNRVKTLLHLSDMNEYSLRYMKHCSKDQVSPQFLQNYTYIANELLDESVVHSKMQPRYVTEQILKRRNFIGYNLDDAYRKNGCEAAEAVQGRDHYKYFTKFTQDKIDALIKDGG